MSYKKYTKPVGYLIIVATILLTTTIIGTAIYYEMEKKVSLYIRFPYIGDLHIDDQFTFHGSPAGTVTGYSHDKEGYVIVHINPSIPLTFHQGYHAYIGDKGIFGERMIYLEDGPKSAPTVSRADTLEGVYFKGISEILGKTHVLKKALKDLNIKMQYYVNGDSTSESVLARFHSLQKNGTKLIKQLHTLSTDLDTDFSTELAELNRQINELHNLSKENRRKVLNSYEEMQKFISSGDTLITSVRESETAINNLIAAIEMGDTLVDVEKLVTLMEEIQQNTKVIHNNSHKLKLMIQSVGL